MHLNILVRSRAFIYTCEGNAQAVTRLENASGSGKQGLLIHYRQLSRGAKASICVETFTDNQPKGKEGTSYFDVLTSPALYEGQFVQAKLSAPENPPVMRFFIEYFDGEDQIQRLDSCKYTLTEGENSIQWKIPDIGGYMIYRLGLELESSTRRDGTLLLRTLDWDGAPERFHLGKAMQLTPSLTPWTTNTTWLKAFMHTAEQFCPDYTTTFSVSHPGKNGVATIGTRDWKDYTVTSVLTLAQQEGAGLVGRACGHRRYYGALLKDNCAVLIKRINEQVTELAKVPYPYQIDGSYTMQLSMCGNKIKMFIDGMEIAEAVDGTFTSGGAGFIVERGAMLADGLTVENLGERV